MTHHIVRQGMTDLLVPVWGIDPACHQLSPSSRLYEPTLQFRLPSDSIAINLITSTDHTMERLLMMS